MNKTNMPLFVMVGVLVLFFVVVFAFFGDGAVSSVPPSPIPQANKETIPLPNKATTPQPKTAPTQSVVVPPTNGQQLTSGGWLESRPRLFEFFVILLLYGGSGGGVLLTSRSYTTTGRYTGYATTYIPNSALGIDSRSSQDLSFIILSLVVWFGGYYLITRMLFGSEATLSFWSSFAQLIDSLITVFKEPTKITV